MNNVRLMFTDITSETKQDKLLSKILYFITQGCTTEIKDVDLKPLHLRKNE